MFAGPPATPIGALMGATQAGLDGRVALVAGVGPGVGRATALGLAAQGAAVVLAARTADHLTDVAAEITAAGGRASCVTVDLTRDDDLEALVSSTLNTFGRLDVLVFNAFAMGSNATVAATTADDWATTFQVNVTAVARLVTLASNALAEATGSVVLVNSQAARRSQVRRGAYSATKAAQLSLARTLAGELGPRGIRVNSVVPGPVWGPSLEAFYAGVAERRGTSAAEVYEAAAADTALRRLVTSEEVAAAIVYFASPASNGITGQSLDVNAGNWFD
jgi:NAD(P)-dependent dehydrogenase (short-subunit alcohol dehydrogenase family)